MAGKDYEKPAGKATIPTGATLVLIPVRVLPGAAKREALVIVSLTADPDAYHIGCPPAALVAVRK